jgi:ABC-2 type transport system ATP-binding protein
MEATIGSGRGVLEIDGLTGRFGLVTALDDLSFHVPPHQVVGFLGPNGAGKTMTMRAIFGLVGLDAGVARWNGAPIGERERRRFGYMPEERGLYPGMLVGEQIEYLGRLHGMSGQDAVRSARTWLERLGVADRAGSKVEALSHGNQQRVQLAAALVHGPTCSSSTNRSPASTRPGSTPSDRCSSSRPARGAVCCCPAISSIRSRTCASR